MGSWTRRVARELPPSAAGALVLAVLFVLISAVSAVTPRGAGERAVPLAAPVASPSPAPNSTVEPRSAFATRAPDVVASPRIPKPTPAPAPMALGSAPIARGIVFRHGEQGQLQGIWRYDGRTGTLQRVGASGRPTVDGRGYVVRQDDGRTVRVDAATGEVAPLAPAGAVSVDAGPADSDLIGAYVMDGDVWVVPRRGVPWRAAEGSSASSVRISPDAKRLAVVTTAPLRPPTGPERTVPTGLWAVDLPRQSPRLLARVQLREMGPVLEPALWSPDGTLLTYWEMSISGSMNADGVRLRAVDVRTASAYDLGVTLFGTSRLSWKAPHTLAYVSGGSRMTWDRKTVRIWSPETGATDVTTSGIGLNPGWSADGTKLYLITADTHDYDPLPYFAGRDSGDRRLSVYDLATRRITTFGPLSGYVYEGVRASRDGIHLLVLWRTLRTARSLDELAPIEMTLGLLDPATGRTTPLVRIAADVGFGFYGSYEGPEGMAWSERR